MLPGPAFRFPCFQRVGPAAVARTVWGEFMTWIDAEGLTPAPGLWEQYVVGPESSPNPADLRTELNRPLIG